MVTHQGYMVTHQGDSADDLMESLIASIRAANDLYFRLVVLAGSPRSGRARVLRRVAERTGGRWLNLNLELSRRLLKLDLTAKQRALRLPQVLEDLLGEYGSPVMICHIEILFDPAFKQDPMRLLGQLSRRRTIVCAWSGVIEEGFLIHGEPGHREYQRCSTEELVLVGTKPRRADHLQ